MTIQLQKRIIYPKMLKNWSKPRRINGKRKEKKG